MIRREARLKGYIVVEDEAGLKVSRMSLAPRDPRVASSRSRIAVVLGCASVENPGDSLSHYLKTVNSKSIQKPKASIGKRNQAK